MGNQIYGLIRFKDRTNDTAGKKGTYGRSCHAVKKKLVTAHIKCLKMPVSGKQTY